MPGLPVFNGPAVPAIVMSFPGPTRRTIDLPGSFNTVAHSRKAYA